MKSICRIVRSVLISSMLLGSIAGTCQANLIAYEAPIDEVQFTPDREEVSDEIIVNTSSKEKSYPSMEEEMDMYMQLKSDIPRVYFFPNPSNGVIWIEHNLGDDTSVQIKDDSGALIFEAKKMKAKKLNLSEFESGTYSIELVKGENRVVRGLKVI